MENQSKESSEYNDAYLEASNLPHQALVSSIIIDYLPQYIFWRDANQRLLGCNLAFANFFGFENCQPLLGKTAAEILEICQSNHAYGAILLDADVSLVTEIAQGEYTSDREIIQTNKSAYYILAISGADPSVLSYFEFRKYPFQHPSTNMTGIITWVEDVSDRQRLEVDAKANFQQLQSALKQLQDTQTLLLQSEKMSSLGQLVAGVAHEINNPVNFIYGNLDHADNYIQDLLQIVQLYQALLTETPPEIRELANLIDLDFIMHDLPKLLASIKVGAQRIKEIVLSLRTFSRMDEDQMKAVNIHEGIDSTLMILEHRLKPSNQHSGIKIIKNYGELPLIECYAGQLNQVFMNLISNAIDALEESLEKSLSSEAEGNNFHKNHIPEPLQITVTTELINSEQVQIIIADNGTGIPSHIQNKLFDPFFTTKPIGKGTGMGLSISYKIITERHHGSIQCVSRVGEGTEFIITIPVRQSSTSRQK